VSERDTEQAKKDRYELGDVEHISDLTPDREVGPSRKKHEQQRLLDPSNAGYFEIEAGASGGLGAPLHIGPELKKDGGPIIGEYEAGYNTYALPLQATLRALGRIKDVSMTGAPLTPAELKQKPKLAARFRRLNSLDHGLMQEMAYNQWSTSQTNFHISIKRFGASQHEMMAVATDFRRVQQLIQQRQAEAKKAQRTAELKQLEQVAKTLANITEFSLMAWSAIGRLEVAIAQAMTLNDKADGADAESYPTGHQRQGACEQAATRGQGPLTGRRYRGSRQESDQEPHGTFVRSRRNLHRSTRQRLSTAAQRCTTRHQQAREPNSRP
jgi:hypothetical protein